MKPKYILIQQNSNQALTQKYKTIIPDIFFIFYYYLGKRGLENIEITIRVGWREFRETGFGPDTGIKHTLYRVKIQNQTGPTFLLISSANGMIDPETCFSAVFISSAYFGFFSFLFAILTTVHFWQLIMSDKFPCMTMVHLWQLSIYDNCPFLTIVRFWQLSDNMLHVQPRQQGPPWHTSPGWSGPSGRAHSLLTSVLFICHCDRMI